MSVVLQTSGNRVMALGSAESVMSVIRAERPDLILLDLKLPGMNGLELARMLKADADIRQIPIVAVTAAPEDYSRLAALEAGCDAYFTKPLNTRHFAEQVAVAADPDRR